MKAKSGTEEMPFGQLPLYKTEKGRILSGSNLIFRHVARRYGGLYFCRIQSQA